MTRWAGFMLGVAWTPEPYSLLLGAAGLVAAALMLGLYLGERGRRQDAQRIARVDVGDRADIVVEPTPEERAAATLRPVELETLAERIAAAEGVSLRQARKAAADILEQAESWSGPGPEEG